MLQAMVERMTKPASLSETRTVAISLLAFAAFLRFDEIAKLRCCDVAFKLNHMELVIRSSKTDQLRKGNQVLVARLGSTTCPVKIISHWLRSIRHHNKGCLEVSSNLTLCTREAFCVGGRHGGTLLSPCIFFTVEATMKWRTPLMSTSPVLSIDTNNKALFYCASKNTFSQRGLWFSLLRTIKRSRL